MNYKQKYLKYKLKYLTAKKLYGGSADYGIDLLSGIPGDVVTPEKNKPEKNLSPLGEKVSRLSSKKYHGEFKIAEISLPKEKEERKRGLEAEKKRKEDEKKAKKPARESVIKPVAKHDEHSNEMGTLLSEL